ncbi:hypothetical protein [Nocardioides solisilvae]|nr:hypothetical protein [Nocardioides solisilvae]
MTSQENEPQPTDQPTDETIEEQSGAEGQDQDAEPTLNAPEEGRPDGR